MTNSTDLITAQQAQNKAVALVEKYRSENAMVFVQAEDLQTQKIFLPEIVKIHATADDFHNISGQFAPKGYMTDRIGEAAGVSFIAEGCGMRKEGDNTYIGWAQGKRRQPDGTWRTSPVCYYEFDVDVRAAEDFAKDKKGFYTTPAAQAKHKIELKKYACQRANTGAQLRVIHKLVGLPSSFKNGDIQRAMVFSRVAINTDQLLADPATRGMAINQAIGAQKDIFGPQERNVTPPQEALPEPVEQAQEEAADDFNGPVGEEAKKKTNPSPQEMEALAMNMARAAMEEWMQSPIIQGSASAMASIKELLANENATLEELHALNDKCRDYETRKSTGGGA